MTATNVEPLRRCCARHPDWTTIAEHLVADFADLTAGDVVAQVQAAKAAVARFGLAEPDQLETGELLARHQLLIMSGSSRDVARLDPEMHGREPVKP
jgi:hypothetical protein